MALLKTLFRPLEIYCGYSLESTPIGFAAETRKGPGRVLVNTCGLITSTDATYFRQAVDMTATALKPYIEQVQFPLDLVDNCVVAVFPDQRALSWINWSTSMKVRLRNSVATGQALRHADIADIQEAWFSNLEVPDCLGILASIQVQWHRLIYFDFSGVHSGEMLNRVRAASLALASGARSVMFHRRIAAIRSDRVRRLYADGWYPFTRLPEDAIVAMEKAYSSDGAIDYAFQGQIKEYLNDSRLSQMLEGWLAHSTASPRRGKLERAVDRYLSQDWISCAHILAAELTGLLDDFFADGKRTSQADILGKIAKRIAYSDRDTALIIPEEFATYLAQGTLAGFEPDQKVLPFGRHTVAHGRLGADQFSESRCIQMLLVIDELFFICK